ncbi:MAG: hypothetical protein WC522_08925 [Candidatus Omnitrophota bacterium]
MVKKLVVVFCLIAFSGLAAAFAQEEPIGRMFKTEPVKVYIKEIQNQSGQNTVTPEILRKALEQSLNQRRAIKFQVVKTPAESDVQIAAVITKYQYLERGPFKPNPGIGTMLLEAAATASHNYVELAVDYTVTDARGEKQLWQKTISEYIKKNMTPDESIPLICDAGTRAFVWKCFGKASLK